MRFTAGYSVCVGLGVGTECRGKRLVGHLKKEKNKLLFSGSYISKFHKSVLWSSSNILKTPSHRLAYPASPLPDSIITYSLGYCEMPQLFIKAQGTSVSIVSFIYFTAANPKCFILQELPKLDRKPQWSHYALWEALGKSGKEELPFNRKTPLAKPG